MAYDISSGKMVPGDWSMGALPKGGVPGIIPEKWISKKSAEALISKLLDKKNFLGMKLYKNREDAEKELLSRMKKHKIGFGSKLDPKIEKRNLAILISGEEAYRVVGGPKVKEIMDQITSTEKAKELLREARDFLLLAYARTSKVPWIASRAGLKEAHRESIMNVARYIERIMPNVKEPLTDKTKNSVALAIVQAQENLKKVDESISDPELRLLPTFMSKIYELLRQAAERAKDIPEGLFGKYFWPVALLGGGAVLYIKLKDSTK